MQWRTKSSEGRKRLPTKAITNGGVQYKFVVLVFKIRLVSGENDALRNPATGYSQTLVAIGPGQICVSKKTDDNFLTKISHGGK